MPQTTFVHRVFAPLKKILPAPVARSVRGLATAVLTPFYFSYRSGHFVSSLRSRAMDRRGKPLPWYTYPAIDFLNAKAFVDTQVLEFGAGQSTLWWAEHAAQVVSFEENEGWYNFVKRKIPGNVELHYCPDLKLRNLKMDLVEQQFDIIIVDGFDRFAAVKESKHYLAPTGILILDNSEGSWGEDGTYPIIDLLYADGMMRTDFYGQSPANILPSCTSIFFREKSRLFHAKTPPVLRS